MSATSELRGQVPRDPTASTGAARRRPWRTMAALLATTVIAAMLATTSEVRAAGEVHLTAAGDYGARAATDTVLRKVAELDPDAHIALGDLGYQDVPTESAWCAYVKARVGEGFPFQLLSGNHESLDQADGLINNFSACLPNQIPGVVGTYGREYYMDLPSTQAPLVRVINASVNLTFEDGRWAYAAGDAHYTWLSNAIDDARAKGAKWVVVSSHYPCLSTGVYTCPGPSDFYQLLLAKKVDLVLNGHEHSYMRTHQLTNGVAGCTAIPVNNVFDPDCVVDTDNAYSAGFGSVFATVGTGGITLRNVNTADPEAGYFARSSGLNLDPTHGLLDMRATDTTLTASFVGTSGGGLTDAFTITRGGPPPTTTTTTTTTTTPTTTTPTTTTTTTTTTPATVLADDQFTRTLAQGWGTAPVGGTWSVSSAPAFSVDGNAGRSSTAAGSGRSAFLRSVTSDSTDLYMSFSTDKAATGSGLYLYATPRSITSVGEYRATVKLASNGVVTIGLWRMIGATSTAIGSTVTVPGVTHVPGQPLLLRLQATGTNPTTFRARLWAQGSAEPSTWTVTGTDATAALQAPGFVGFTTYLSGAATNAPIAVVVDELRAVRP